MKHFKTFLELSVFRGIARFSFFPVLRSFKQVIDHLAQSFLATDYFAHQLLPTGMHITFEMRFGGKRRGFEEEIGLRDFAVEPSFELQVIAMQIIKLLANARVAPGI